MPNVLLPAAETRLPDVLPLPKGESVGSMEKKNLSPSSLRRHLIFPTSYLLSVRKWFQHLKDLDSN